MKWIIILLIVAAIAGGGWWYYKTSQETAPEYQTAVVGRGDLTQVVTATGQLGPVLNVQVGSQISGIVKKLLVDFNSVVKSNQLIAEIDPSTYELSVLKAKALLANSKANLTLAEVQAHRSDELFTNKLVSASDHDIANAQLLQAQAQVQSDEATLKNAEVQLSYCTIYAPVDGVVISRNVDVGQTVAASFNTPTLFLIANDLTKMQIDALVSEADIGNVAVDQNVNFTVDAFPYRTFHGKLSQIRYGAITNQNVINYDCVIDVNNSDLKLLPSMTANVSIVIAERNNVLKVPNAALRFRPPEPPGAPKTNATAQAFSQTQRSGSDGAGGGFRQRGEGGGGGFRQRGEGGGGGPPAAGPGGQRGPGAGVEGGRPRPRPERQMARTVYVLESSGNQKQAPKLKPVQVKLGITDGASTEVLDGLEEGMQVVTGMISGVTETSTRATSNPFSGGRRF
ncbi:MAG TPA: efflux RND transporter periplasmic adaptor subunit [Patescibacteria group bacterium]|nr:efflux RND transporter periplasmic adaptor subunit [Patescibacteria group bacterium]